MCFHIHLEEKKNETVALYPTFLAQENNKNDNTITQIQEKTENAIQHQLEFER